MKPFAIPVRMVGPGSQPVEDEELQYLAMPREMNTFRMPLVPERADTDALTGSRDLLASFLHQMVGWNPAESACGPQLDLAGVSPASLEITNQMLGEGEVSIQISGTRSFRIQESVFTGLWRVCELDAGGTLASDWLEVAALPRVAVQAAREAADCTLAPVEFPVGAMNSPALLCEIEAQMRGREPGARAHVVNLTLFPMTPEDHQVLDQALPIGPVAMISRGFGNCRITSTGARNVWRVQYFNNMNTLILNTIEIVDLPEVALAATEDLEDSRTRLAELIDWMSESCAEQAAE